MGLDEQKGEKVSYNKFEKGMLPSRQGTYQRCQWYSDRTVKKKQESKQREVVVVLLLHVNWWDRSENNEILQSTFSGDFEELAERYLQKVFGDENTTYWRSYYTIIGPFKGSIHLLLSKDLVGLSTHGSNNNPMVHSHSDDLKGI